MFRFADFKEDCIQQLNTTLYVFGLRMHKYSIMKVK